MHQPIDHVVHAGETALFTLFLERWETMLVEETRREAGWKHDAFGPRKP